MIEIGTTNMGEAPHMDNLVHDLKLVRRRGIVALRRLDLPALSAAAHAAGHADSSEDASAPVIESLLRDAMADMEGSRYGEAGSVLLGLSPGTRGDNPPLLRKEAARAFEVSPSRFRNHYEHIIIDQLAELILKRCHEHQMRLSMLAMERKLPTSSRLAVAWLDRFEAYYAMWTPIYATAASLEAYRAMLLDEDRPYDRAPTPREPAGFTQEKQAEMYVSHALFFLAEYLIELRRFRTRFGGLWILSSKQADSDIADSSYLVHYRAPFTEREGSFLMKMYRETEGVLDDFLALANSDPCFIDVHAKWQRFAATCQCSWPTNEQPERGHFHAHRTTPTIDESCQPHQIIAAANDYCTSIDYEWDLIADWYHIGEPRRAGVYGGVLYEEFRADAKRQGTKTWPPWEVTSTTDDST